MLLRAVRRRLRTTGQATVPVIGGDPHRLQLRLYHLRRLSLRQLCERHEVARTAKYGRSGSTNHLSSLERLRPGDGLASQQEVSRGPLTEGADQPVDRARPSQDAERRLWQAQAA